jgi:hypothetical protein
MIGNDVFTLEKIPKNGRLDKYDRELSTFVNEKDVSKLEAFMFKLFSDCMNYLKKVLDVDFPNIMLKIIYKKEEYDELCRKLDRVLLKPRTKAITVICGSQAFIYIDFQSHFKNKPLDFITNLSVSYLEELVHVVNPNKSETEIQELVSSVIEGFLEVKLPDEVKQERLKRARIFNGH